MVEPLDHFPSINYLMVRGFDFISALQEITETVLLNYRSGRDIQITTSRDWGTGFNIHTDKSSGFISINNTEKLGMELFDFTEKLRKVSLIEDRQPLIKQAVIKNVIDKNKELQSIDSTQIVEIIKMIGDTIMGFDPSLKYNINLEINHLRKIYQSSDSMDITQVSTRNLLSIEVFSLLPNQKRQLRKVIGGIQNEYLNADYIQNITYTMLKELSSMSGKKKITYGSYPVILHPDSSFSLIHESIGHAVEADQVITGNSFLSNKLGHVVSSDLLNITDDPNINQLGWLVYDDEGVKSQGTQIVEEGILSNFVHSKKTAELFGTYSTGNARSSSYVSPPEPRQTNLYVEPGDMSFDELLEVMGNGILVGSTNSANTSIFSGLFNIQSQNAYIVEHGEVGSCIGPVTLSDHSLHVLSRISGIGKNLESIPSVCLKEDSRLFIGGLAPYILVDDIILG
ncbi:MAG: TldD/PmbA family protein [Candidatus Heimdallarchaeota archaeon]|nr:TldD/PmbA family protein [Candidatus Heimdallarchaeota archaeon]